jgi:hypothetical protein
MISNFSHRKFSGALTIKVQESQIKQVDNAMLLVANRPRKWTINSLIEYLLFPCAVRMTPQASSCAKVMEHGRLYLAAIFWKSCTSRASWPSPKRYFGVSLRRTTVIRATLITKTNAPLVYITYLQPMLLAYVQSEVRTPFLSNGSGQFHFAGAA